MEIIIDSRFWGVKHTGLGRYTQSLVENLLKLDKRNNYSLIVNKKELNNVKTWLKDLSFKPKIKFYPTPALPYSLNEQLTLPCLLKKIKPDLIHFPHFNTPIFSSFPYVVTIHDLIKHHFRGLGSTTRQAGIYLLKYLGYKQVFKTTVKKAQRIIVPSNFVKEQLVKQYPDTEAKIKVIYEGVNKEYLKQSSTKTKPATILNKYQITKPFLIYTGNLYPHKNIRSLILAVKMVRHLRAIKNQSALNLVLVSSRDVFAKRLKKTIKDYKAQNFIKLPGFIPDKELKIIYTQAKAFISPSLMEGFGLPGLEAMAASCPVLGSDIPTFKEIYGPAGIYFNPKEINDIKEKIIKLMDIKEAERKKLIIKARNQVKKYSWKKTSQDTLKIYQAVKL